MARLTLVFAVSCLASIANAIASPSSSLLTRPKIKAWPYSPGHHPSSPCQHHKYCYVKPTHGSDDAANILAAFHKCNNGGTVVLDANYTIASPLDLTFLKHVDVSLTGTVNFAPNIAYWTDHMFRYAYQNSSAFWRIGGTDVNIFGHGVGLLNGNGQPWYDAFAANPALLRPILFVLDGLHGGSVTGLHMINPPNVRLLRHLQRTNSPLLTFMVLVVQPHRE